MLTFCAGVHRLGDLRRGGGEAAVALGPVGMELDVSQMDREALGGVHGGQGRRVVAGNPQIAGVDMQGVRDPQLIHRPTQGADDVPRGERVVGVALIHVERAGIEFEGADPAGVDHLDTDALGGVQGPGDIVVDDLLVRPLAHELEQEVVVAEHGVAAGVQHGGIGHLHVCLAGVHRQDGGLEGRRIAHLRITIASREGRWRGMPAPGAGQGRAGAYPGALVLREHGAGNVDLAPADMGVQIDGPGHDQLAGEVIGALRSLPGGRRGEDLSIAQIEVADLAVDPLRRVVQSAADEFGQHGVCSPRGRVRAARRQERGTFICGQISCFLSMMPS